MNRVQAQQHGWTFHERKANENGYGMPIVQFLHEIYGGSSIMQHPQSSAERFEELLMQEVEMYEQVYKIRARGGAG